MNKGSHFIVICMFVGMLLGLAIGCVVGNTSALTDKLVIITGGGGGIAQEARIALAYLGAKVIIGEVDDEKGRRAEGRITALFPDRARYIPLDLEDPDVTQAFCEKVSAEYGTPYAIIHNATITPFDSIERLPLADWDRSYRVVFRKKAGIRHIYQGVAQRYRSNETHGLADPPY